MIKQFRSITYCHYFPSIKDNPNRKKPYAGSLYNSDYLPIWPKNDRNILKSPTATLGLSILLSRSFIYLGATLSRTHKFKSKIHQMFRRQLMDARGKFIALSACVVSHLVVSNSAIPWTAAHQDPLSMGFSRQEHWNGLPFTPPGEALSS